MAIVMKYHADRGYRAEGKGRHSYVDDGEEYAADFGAYDWANMPDRTEDFTSTVQRQAVARLMHHCAVSIESDFEVDGTGSINWRTSVALTSFFGYDGKLGYILKEEYSDAEWKKMIRNEIDADRPVIYDGDQKHGGGHSFVLSGYSDADLYFFNWGWGGRSNGWYALSALTPSIYDFSYGQGMLTGIQEASGEPISSLRLVKGRQSQTNPDGIVITEEGSRFIIHGGTFENRSYQPFFGSIGVALTDAGGAIREIVGSNDNCMLDGNHYRNNSRYIGDLYCTMTVAAAATDHLRFVSSEDNRQTWQTIYGAPGIAWETSVANEAIDPSPSVRVTGTVEGLRVNSPYSETLRVYSPEGRMLFEGFKQAGERRFDVRLPGGIVIVRSDHWVRKIINN
jgi:hypothetical protein